MFNANQHSVELKLMSNKEKDQLGLSVKANPTRIQVLKRDAKGKITEYKLINNDNDIVKYTYR